MGYFEVSEMSGDPDLTARVRACAAQESTRDPYQWTAANMLEVCSAPGWDAAWTSALAAGVPTPGRDPAVISDAMILSAVQPLIGAP